MKYRLNFWTISLLTALLASACTPAATLQRATAEVTLPPEATQTLIAATQTQVPTEAPTRTPIPVATSRGPNLEATDPTTVVLASGGLQFVEFFRFT